VERLYFFWRVLSVGGLPAVAAICALFPNAGNFSFLGATALGDASFALILVRRTWIYCNEVRKLLLELSIFDVLLETWRGDRQLKRTC
jgi:hypothetical protein